MHLAEVDLVYFTLTTKHCTVGEGYSYSLNKWTGESSNEESLVNMCANAKLASYKQCKYLGGFD